MLLQDSCVRQFTLVTDALQGQNAFLAAWLGDGW
jgi:hypothetical protein